MPIYKISGDVKFDNIKIEGSATINGGVVIDYYEGEYTIIPDTNQQILETEGKNMLHDLIVKPIPSNYIDTTDATVNSNGQILNGYSAYANGVLYEGSIPSLASQSYTPGAANQTIGEGQYLSGDQTILGDANLIASNIKNGVTIFGVQGNVIPKSSDPSINYNLMYLLGNKGFRQLNGSISGNGTDPNWRWWDLVSTEGYTQIKYYMQGYSTVASIMWFDSSKTKISEIHANGLLNGVVDIPEGASYVAISCRNNESGTYMYQFCFMY